MNDDAHTDQPLLLDTQALEGFWQAFAYDERNLALLPDQEFVAKANDILDGQRQAHQGQPRMAPPS